MKPTPAISETMRRLDDKAIAYRYFDEDNTIEILHQDPFAVSKILDMPERGVLACRVMPLVEHRDGLMVLQLSQINRHPAPFLWMLERNHEMLLGKWSYHPSKDEVTFDVVLSYDIGGIPDEAAYGKFFSVFQEGLKQIDSFVAMIADGFR